MNKPINIIVNVLDDQLYILELIRDMFSDLKEYQVSYFTDPFQFTDAITFDVDLVITDIRVGGGYDALETIKRINEESPSTNIIVMSAFFDVPFMQQLMRLTVKDTVVKTPDKTWIANLKESVLYLHSKLYSRAELRATVFNK